MNKDLHLNLIKLARVGANSLGSSQTPQSMLDIWGVIKAAEDVLNAPVPDGATTDPSLPSA